MNSGFTQKEQGFFPQNPKNLFVVKQRQSLIYKDDVQSRMTKHGCDTQDVDEISPDHLMSLTIFLPGLFFVFHIFHSSVVMTSNKHSLSV